jgi:hypothetical protein
MALWSLFGRESSEGAFCVLGIVGGKSRSLDFASASLRESDAALGMTEFSVGNGVENIRSESL